MASERRGSDAGGGPSIGQNAPSTPTECSPTAQLVRGIYPTTGRGRVTGGPNDLQTREDSFVTLRHMGAFQLVEQFKQDIAEHGYTVAAVTGDLTGCDWAYSVGLDHSFGHPELIIIGLDAPLAGAIIQAMADKVASGIDLRVGHGVRIGPMGLHFTEVDDLFASHGDWFNLGREVMSDLGRRWPPTMQIVWADDDGRFPERSDDPEWFMRQPLLVGASRQDVS